MKRTCGEAYLRFHNAGYVRVSDRPHFLAYAARAMRSIVVDFVRKRGAPWNAKTQSRRITIQSWTGSRDGPKRLTRPSGKINSCTGVRFSALNASTEVV